MKTLRLTLVSVLCLCAVSVCMADAGQLGRKKHRDMADAVLKARAAKAESKTEAEVTGQPLIEKCKDLVIKKGKRTTVIQCGNPKRDNPDCLVCGVKE